MAEFIWCDNLMSPRFLLRPFIRCDN